MLDHLALSKLDRIFRQSQDLAGRREFLWLLLCVPNQEATVLHVATTPTEVFELVREFDLHTIDYFVFLLNSFSSKCLKYVIAIK